MGDEDFKISFKAETEQAIAAMRKLLEVAQLTERAINSSIDAVGKAGGAPGLTRVASDARTSKKAVDAFSTSVDALVASFKNLSKEAQLALSKDIKTTLPRIQGKIELSQNAGQVIPQRDLDTAERILENIRKGLVRTRAATDDVREAEEKLAQIRSIGTTQKEAADQLRLAAAAEKVATAERKTAAAATTRLQNSAGRIDQSIAKALSQPEAPSNTASLLQKGISVQSELAARGFKQAANMADIYKGALQRLEPVQDKEIATLRKQIAALEEGIVRSTEFGKKATGTQLVRGRQLNEALLSRAQIVGDKAAVAEATTGVKKYGDEIDSSRLRLDAFNASLRTHAARIAEGLFIYNALGRGLALLQDSVQLVSDTGVELTRFELVAGNLSSTDLDDFVRRLGTVSVNTNTSLKDLVATSDQVTASFVQQGAASADIKEQVLAFQEIAGQFSNVVPGVGQEQITTELVALFRQLEAHGGDLGDFRRLMDQITVAGEHSATVIDQTTRALVELAPAANATGVSLSFTATILAELVKTTGRTGTELGSLLQTTFSKLQQPDVIKKAFGDIGQGIVTVADDAGRLLPAQKILENFFDAIKEGKLSTGIATNILQELGPPLQPGAIGINSQLIQAGITARQRLGTGGDVSGAAGDLQAESDRLIDTLSGRMGQLLNQFTNIVAIGFANPIKESVESVISVFKRLADILQDEGVQHIVAVVTKVGLLVAANLILWAGITRVIQVWKLLKGVVDGVVTAYKAQVSGITAASTSMATSSRLAKTTSIQWAGAGKGISGAGIAAASSGTAASVGSIGWRTLGFAITGVATALKAVLPLLVAYAALTVAGKFFEAQDVNKTVDLAGDKFSNRQIKVPLPAGQNGVKPELPNANLGDLIKLGDTLQGLGDGDKKSEAQVENLIRLRTRLVDMMKAGTLTPAKANALADAIIGPNGEVKTDLVDLDQAMSDIAVTMSGVGDAYEGSTPPIDANTAAFDANTAAAERTLLVLKGANSLLPQQIKAWDDLEKQLKDGTITQEDFATQFGDVNTAADLASRAVVILGDSAKNIPAVGEIMKRTSKTAQEALFDMFRASPDAISNIQSIISQAEQLQSSADQIREDIEKHPITPHFDGSEEIAGQATHAAILSNFVEGTDLANETFKNAPITPQVDLLPLQQSLQTYLKMISSFLKTNSVVQGVLQATGLGFLGQAATGVLDTLGNAKLPEPAGGTVGSKQISDLQAITDAAIAALAKLGGNIGGAPSKSQTDRTQQQTPIIDIGDLKESQIQQIIAIAAAAQKKVVAAGGKVDTDEVAAIFKGTAFEQLVKGIDQRFLQKAIQELTDVEKKRLELEQQRLQDVTRNTVVRVGPIQSLISSPVLSAGGGVLSGQGLNADPTQGNFTINVPINWSGMNLKQLQEFIYKTIAQAWTDAGRGG